MLNWQQLEQLASTYPGIETGTSYGTPALKASKKLIVRLHQKEDAYVVLLESVEEQQRLIEQDPMTFYITDHYQGYPAVLVRPMVSNKQMQALIERRWAAVAAKKDLKSWQAETNT